MRIFDRYIWREFFTWFLICTLGFTILGLGKIVFDYNDLFIGYRVAPKLMCQLIIDQIPTLWMDVLPAATIFGAILGLGRLVRERELDVIRVCGASLFRTMLPTFLGIGLMCFGAYWWNDLVVPAANNRFQKEVQRLSVRQDMPLLKENIVFKGPENRFIYLQKVQQKLGQLYGILIIETKQNSEMPRIITAESGSIKKGVWELHQGVIHELDLKGAIVSELSYQKMELKMSNDFAAIIGEEKTPSAMRSSELLHLVHLYKQSGLNVPVFTVYYYSKFADPLISLIFILLAIPLTIQTGRNSLWLGLVYCFLIIMAYYAMQVIGRTMGSNSVIPPWVAVWTPHVFFFLLGLVLIVGMERRR
ncbi:MAG TPA: LptF/LptG family permease [Bacillota bacterium]|nr:LptF/LptG family permease [Bacillota bacterium]